MTGLGTQPTPAEISDFASVDYHPSRTEDDVPANTILRMDDLPWVGWIDPRTGEKNTTVLSKSLLPDSKNHSAAIVWTEPGFTSSPHWHPSDTLYVVLSGEWHIEGEGTYRPGEYRWVPGGTAYGVESTGSEHAQILLISFGPGGRFDADKVPAPNGDVRKRVKE